MEPNKSMSSNSLEKTAEFVSVLLSWWSIMHLTSGSTVARSTDIMGRGRWAVLQFSAINS